MVTYTWTTPSESGELEAYADASGVEEKIPASTSLSTPMAVRNLTIRAVNIPVSFLYYEDSRKSLTDKQRLGPG